MLSLKICPYCHEMGKSFVFPKNRRIPEIIRSLTLILQGGIAFFAIFSTISTISWKIARNEKKSITLPDLKRDSGFSEKSIIWPNNLTCFHEMVHNRIFSGKSNILNRELMSSKCVEFIFYKLKIMKNLGFRIIVY